MVTNSEQMFLITQSGCVNIVAGSAGEPSRLIHGPSKTRQWLVQETSFIGLMSLESYGKVKEVNGDYWMTTEKMPKLLLHDHTYG